MALLEPDTGLDRCPRILFSSFRARISGQIAECHSQFRATRTIKWPRTEINFISDATFCVLTQYNYSHPPRPPQTRGLMLDVMAAAPASEGPTAAAALEASWAPAVTRPRTRPLRPRCCCCGTTAMVSAINFE